MKSPTLSVIMPVYNASNFLHEAIESILNQTFKDFELIILNDKSTDNSLEIINQFIKIDDRICLIDKIENVGPANLRNQGIEISKGKFIALMDADDISEPTRFEEQFNLLSSYQEIGVCGSWFTLFGNTIKSKIIKHAQSHDEIEVNFLEDCNIGNPTIMFKKDAILDFRFDNIFVPIEDYDLWARLLNRTKFYNIQASLLKYRWHDTNISQTKKENIELKHNQIRKKLIGKLGNFDDNQMNEYLKVFKFETKLTLDSLILKLENGKKIMQINRELQIYNDFYFAKKVNEIASKSIEKVAVFNLKFLYYILKNEINLFKKIPFMIKIKIILKSIFSFKQF